MFTDCPPDGFTNIFDRNHVLTCFAGTNTCDPLNIDVGGPFGDCNPDGFCNLFDANHVLTAFAGTNPCTCPSNPSPAAVSRMVGHAELVLAPSRRSAVPGEIVAVRVLIAGALDGLQSYQLETAVSGGRRGSLELVNVSVEERSDHVFAGEAEAFSAFSPLRAQMLSGLNAGAVKTAPKAYLATFTYRATPDAAGKFVVDIARKTPDQSVLLSDFIDQFEIDATRPAVIAIEPPTDSR